MVLIAFAVVLVFDLVVDCNTMVTSNSSFPTDEFYDYFTEHECYMHTRPDSKSSFISSYTCAYHDPEYQHFCSCDLTRCIRLKDCCIDVFWEESRKMNLSQYIDLFIEKHEPREDQKPPLSCEPMLPTLVLPTATKLNYKMVSTCSSLKPHGKSNDTDCDLPVIGDDGDLYKSAYFAACNHVKEYKLVDIIGKTFAENINPKSFNVSVIESLQLEDGFNKVRCRIKPVSTCTDNQYKKLEQVFDMLVVNNEYINWATLIRFSGNKMIIGNVFVGTTHQNCVKGQTYRFTEDKCINKTCASHYTTHNETCVMETRLPLIYTTASLSWQVKLNQIEYYISIIGTPMSLCGYIWAILSFIYFNELQNLPRLNTICMTSALLVTDSLYFVVLAFGDGIDGTFCKILAITIHWFSLCAMIWAFITALDLAITFYSNVIIPSQINRKRFFTYFLCAVTIPTAFVTVTLLLDRHDVIDAGYGDLNICWLTNFESRLYMYIIPIAVGYAVTISALLYIITSLSRKIASSRSIMKSSITHGHKTTKFIINLSLVLGVSEIIGFIQIRRANGEHSENELIINAVFLLCYVILRSLRGVFIGFIYIFNKITLRVLKVSFRKRFPKLFDWNDKKTYVENNSVASRQTAYLSSTHI